ncbi:MAG: transposase [Thermodesulfovibrionales bacterium]
MVDLLMDAGYRVHLANPSRVEQYAGLKHGDDEHDAFWLAEMLRLKILPEGFIYPKTQRPPRDLLRKRGHPVRLRTSLILSLQNILARNVGTKMRANHMKALKKDRVAPLLAYDDDLSLAGRVSKDAIDSLTRQITAIEVAVEKKIDLKRPYDLLLTKPGVGRVLALTIMLETGPIHRFADVGNYVSYCRKVPAGRFSNDKKKGTNNTKNGNKYLSWAFAEAGELARRFDPLARAYYDRKQRRTNAPIAHSALSNKVARAAFYIMRDGVPFMPKKAFS